MQKKPTHCSIVTALMAVATVTPLIQSSALAQSSGSYSSLAQREMERRIGQVNQSDRLRDEARAAYAQGEYKEAYDKYSQALGLLPDAPLLQDRIAFLKASRGDAAAALADQYRKFGKYDEARTMLNEVLEDDPNNMAANRQLEWLDDPIRTNPALTEDHVKDIDKVRQGLYMANGYYELGKFDEAYDTFEDVLRVDKYNTAARRGMEKVNQAKALYYKAAYDHTRSELLRQVDEAWEIAVPPNLPTADIPLGGPVRNTQGATYLLQKLRNIVIPTIDFEDAPVSEVIDYLRVRSIELDDETIDPAQKGVNFVIQQPRAAAGTDGDGGASDSVDNLRIDELRLRNLPLAEVLDYITQKTGLRWTVDEFAVNIRPANDLTGADLFTRTYNVPPDFLARIGNSSGPGGGTDDPFDPFAGDDGGSSSSLRPRMSVTEALEANGVSFPEGASAQFFPANSTLLVRNTPTNLDIVEQVVNSVVGEAPKQVRISTKFVEITQENTDELGFDWIVSPFDLGGSLFPGGGVLGNGQVRTAADYVGSIGGIDGIPAAPGENVYNTLTGGLRSGDGATNRNSIDALLNNPDRTAQNTRVAPGIMSLTGLFSSGQVQMIMRGLAQKKGSDLMTAPSVTARSGETATIEVIREFIYPTEYEPPEIPQNIGNNGNNGGGGVVDPLGGQVQSFPVTPANPTAFETRNTGVTLEIAPNIDADGFVIDLSFAPEIVEFEGFINYGSPIQAPAVSSLGVPTTVTITENRIEMPVFSKRSVNTALTIFDGYTVAVGGLMREDVQIVEDKVPILGDIPLVGRLFQSNAENRIKSNLIIFVTADIIDATGRKINDPTATATPDDSGIGSGIEPTIDGGVGVLPGI